ncbi:MAG: SEC-C metal-binding domain-containing protein [Eubacteriales bacterium]|jgi:hypothetical protein|nr:SEC-C metal-binding domain-containing protein [Eubacteriales bacterium]
MDKKNKTAIPVSREDAGRRLDSIERNVSKPDPIFREILIRVQTGEMTPEAARNEMSMRGGAGAFVQNRAPVTGLERCIRGLSVAALRQIIMLVMLTVMEAQPPREYIPYLPRGKKRLSPEVETDARINYIEALDWREKSDLQEDALRLISDKRIVRALMLGMDAADRELFADAINGGPGISMYAVTRGFLYVFGGKKSQIQPLSCVVPEEIKEIWHGISEAEFEVRDDVVLYLSAAANLYAIIPTEEAFELLRHYDEKDGRIISMRYEEILDIANLCSYVGDSFSLRSGNGYREMYLIGNKYLGEVFANEDDDDFNFSEAYDAIKRKPRYIPPREEFIKYADPDYYEVNPQFRALRAYLADTLVGRLREYAESFNKPDYSEYSEYSNYTDYTRYTVYFNYLKELLPAPQQSVTPEKLLDYFMSVISHTFQTEQNTLESMLDLLDDVDMQTDNADDMRSLLNLIMSAYNSARNWRNKGYTPGEMVGHGKILPMPDTGIETVRVPPRVGRNDPCPCGSGKKYKKCCGR